MKGTSDAIRLSYHWTQKVKSKFIFGLKGNWGEITISSLRPFLEQCSAISLACHYNDIYIDGGDDNHPEWCDKM